MRYLLPVVLSFCASAAVAEPVSYAFEWKGNGGYSLRGGLSYDTATIKGQLVEAQDLSCFVVQGLKDGQPIGRWALSMLNEETTWRLFFDTLNGQFLVEGMGIDMPQGWNMDGAGIDCGQGGFGFNIGDAAQDICLNGELIVDSQVDPQRLFPAVRDDDYEFPNDACTGPMMMSALTGY